MFSSAAAWAAALVSRGISRAPGAVMPWLPRRGACPGWVAGRTPRRGPCPGL